MRIPMAETGSVFRDHRILVRVIYVAYVVLWWYLNKNNIILSQWDTEKIGVPVLWYMMIPTVSLLLYAIFPKMVIWLLPAATLAIGWTLHVKESLAITYAHLHGKVEMVDFVIAGVSLFFVLSVLLTVLYLSGPFINKRLQCKDIT